MTIIDEYTVKEEDLYVRWVQSSEPNTVYCVEYRLSTGQLLSHKTLHKKT